MVINNIIILKGFLNLGYLITYHCTYLQTCILIQFFLNAVYREVCIEFNHSQLNYYTELDAVSLGGLLEYPENGGLETVSMPFMTGRNMCNDIDFDDQELFTDIKTPDVIYLQFVLIIIIIIICNGVVCISSRYKCQQV